MKRLVAYISLILYVGCANGILLMAYNQAGNNRCSDKSSTTNCFAIHAATSADASSHSKFSTPEFITLDALTTATGKIKLPEASSCSVITATFAILPYQVFYNSAVTDPAQLYTEPTPIFLKNCVLRL